MDDYLNDVIAYFVIGTVGAFVAAAGFVALRRRLRIVRSTRRHRRLSAALPVRPAMVVLPAEGDALRPAKPSVEAPETSLRRVEALEPDPAGLDFFSAFEDRLAQIRSEIEALDSIPAG